jgi:transcriptional regulator with XRE-family HTH domain
MEKLNFVKIGAKIRQCRINAGMTQEQLSEKLDVNQSHLSNIECGRAHPSLTMLMNLANILRCNIDAFLDEEYHYSDSAETLNDRVIRELKRLDDPRKEQILRIMQTF